MIRRRYLLRFLVIFASAVVGFVYVIQTAPSFIGGFRLIVDSKEMFDSKAEYKQFPIRQRMEMKELPPTPPPFFYLPFDSMDSVLMMKTREFKGKSEYQIISDVLYGNVLSATSNGTSSMLYYPIDINILKQNPVMSWEWKSVVFPSGKSNTKFGDKNDNDYAVRMYAMFKGGSIFSSDVIQYVWDDHFPEGSTAASPYAANVKLLVIQHGPAPADAGGWVREERNIAEDYRKLFGRDPDKPFAAIGLMSDSDNTRSQSEALIRSVSISVSSDENI